MACLVIVAGPARSTVTLAGLVGAALVGLWWLTASRSSETMPGPAQIVREVEREAAAREAAEAPALRPAGPSRARAPSGEADPASMAPAPGEAPPRRPEPHAEAAVERRPRAPARPSSEETTDPKPHPADAQGIRQAMQDVKPDLQDCYESWLKANPALAGTLKVRFSIRAPEDRPEAGYATVQDIGLLASDVKQPLFEGCVMNAMQDMRFDVPPDGKLDVTYPLRFSNPDAGVQDAG